MQEEKHTIYILAILNETVLTKWLISLCDYDKHRLG